ncbi:hypothetical protein EJ04DRAFT_527220 [Polyplosphaeria fusca]|uniref:Uncharacterized protein n=1 Tax=Polyplosphaeria fusca TaxID=682080 RepID=A0A9P4QR33_9PLEO|nr:hypothetical protein EJ04DRAFT_527220 [Polyplosphaeria fusca]
MATQEFLAFLAFLSLLPSASSAPLPTHKLLARSSSPRKIGISFAIAICVIIFAIIVFYLGMQRGRTGTWFCWRSPTTPSSPPLNPRKLLISPPIPILSKADLHADLDKDIDVDEKAPIELSPVEARLTRLELPAESHVFEMGSNRGSKASNADNRPGVQSPHRGEAPRVRRRSWLNLRHGMERSEQESCVKGKKISLYEMEGSPVDVADAPPVPELRMPSYPERAREGRWSGLEHVRRMFAGGNSVGRG